METKSHWWLAAAALLLAWWYLRRSSPKSAAVSPSVSPEPAETPILPPTAVAIEDHAASSPIFYPAAEEDPVPAGVAFTDPNPQQTIGGQTMAGWAGGDYNDAALRNLSSAKT